MNASVKSPVLGIISILIPFVGLLIAFGISRVTPESNGGAISLFLLSTPGLGLLLAVLSLYRGERVPLLGVVGLFVSLGMGAFFS